MPRFRNEEPEQSHYTDGDVVWVKIHNTEIWWPGEVTSSQDFRFVNSSRPPFAVVAFFNEKTFEQVKSAKLIYPFQCTHKEEFIKRGTKKADGLHMGDKFGDDVAIAESRYQRQLLAGTHSHPDSGSGPASRPDSLIKALLSSSSSYHNSSTRSSSGAPSPLNRQEPTFRIMDIGGSPGHVRERRYDDASYECNICSFRTNSMSVLLIHRRAHLDTGSNYSSHSNSTSTTTSVSSFNPSRQTRAARRAHTTNDPRQLTIRGSRDSTHFHKNSVRCHSRHVSIVVDASLTDEAQQKVASIVKMTMASIERVVHPSDSSSLASHSTRSRSRSNRNSCSSSPKVSTALAPRRSSLNPRDPRSHRSNQLRATMPAPQPPAKQRRLTRSMSRRQQGLSPPTRASELPPPPPMSTHRRSGGRRRTLATGISERSAPPTRRGNPMRKTLTAAHTPVRAPTEHPPETTKRQKRTHSRHRAPVSPASPSVSSSPPPVPPPVDEEEKHEESRETPLPVAVLEPISKPSPPKENLSQEQSHMAASLELQQSLLAEWCDDETEDSPEELSAQQPQPAVNGNNGKRSWEPDRKQEEEQQGEEQEQSARKRIRNIPKKDRRDMGLQEFDTDSQLESSDEPIVIQDSDASSNESVVFVDDEPRQRNKSSNSGEKGKSLTPSKQAPITMSSCFDFEEEEELPDGQNGLSYRHCTARQDGRGHLELAAPPEESAAGKAAYDDLFRGFDEAQRSAAAANAIFDEEQESGAYEERILEAQETENAEAPEEAGSDAEGEAMLEDEADVDADADAEAGDHLRLPIKERQKRIFKSRNMSTLAAAPREEDLPDLPDREEEEDLANGGELNGDEDHSSRRDSTNSNSNANSNSNTNATMNTKSSASGRGSGTKRQSRSKSSSNRRKKSKTESTRRQQWRSKAQTRLQNIALEELSNNSNSTSGNSNASYNSNQLSMASASYRSRSRSQASGAISPGLSSSTSCSIASNIAVISAEEARELQRSASGAGLVHSSIVDATQPVQRGGVLILEDIRLPNLYEPFASLQSSDSNDSRQQVLRSRLEHEDRTQDSTEVDPDVNSDMADMEMGAEGDADTEADADADADTEADAEAEEGAEEESKEQEDRSEAAGQIAEDVAEEDKDEEQDSSSVGPTAADLDSWQPEEVQFVPKPREVLLKKREQELLRQYKADLVSGRSAEKCRKARERWSRTAYSTEEAKSSPVAPEQEEPVPSVQDQGTELESPAEIEEAAVEDHNVDTIASEDSMVQQLAAVEGALPAMLMSPARRPASHPGVNSLTPDPSFSSSTISPSKSSGDLAQALCDAVIKAHQQLANLREQRRRRSSPTFASAPSTPSTPSSPPPPAAVIAGGTRRPRRRSRTATGNELVETLARSDATEGFLCEPKDGSDSLENPPQLCAGRICAVMTRPIPGYNHTFMLCSLANNNFTPLNNVALYLDSEKNHLVPVPREALLEPPRLADGHPLSAVFADIDFLGGEAVAQVVDPTDPQADASLAQSEVRLSPPQIILSNAEELEGEPADTLGIMTPLSQVAEGCAGTVTGFANEEEELFEDQLPDNVLQLNVNGHRLELDPSVLVSIAQQPDTCIELSVVETGPDGSGTMAVLHAQDILEAAQAYLQERDLQLVNLEELTLGHGSVDAESAAASGLVVPTPNLLDDSVHGFVDPTDAGVGLLHIDTRTPGGPGPFDVDEESNNMVFISHALPPQTAHAHLTPPITARTNETNALLDQTPIMSTLENPSGVQLRRVSPLVDGNLEDSLAVIGVTHGSGVPTSLELPITVTNPAIAPRMANDIVHFGPFQ
ncbi:uncharacterized protein Dana_GF20195, isoform B [Drosophila ananassae]|uniref:Uncharacterized protein, isoform B n=1 Tax=Drosophila ananassae TaxID=7217 RepID=A0A0P8Y2X8_DROAN|nr:uncharacterized protein LOC6502907 [Drosophila ananassae]KPU81687.1 uncharacterized protein Dana_GF20195, isoform B [Drosophila ananassae]